MKFYATLILSLIFSLILYSQDTNLTEDMTNDINASNETVQIDRISISLEDALMMAFDYDKTLKQAEYDVRIAQVQKDASFSDLFLPSLSISGGLNLAESPQATIL